MASSFALYLPAMPFAVSNGTSKSTRLLAYIQNKLAELSPSLRLPPSTQVRQSQLPGPSLPPVNSLSSSPRLIPTCTFIITLPRTSSVYSFRCSILKNGGHCADPPPPFSCYRIGPVPPWTSADSAAAALKLVSLPLSSNPSSASSSASSSPPVASASSQPSQSALAVFRRLVVVEHGRLTGTFIDCLATASAAPKLGTIRLPELSLSQSPSSNSPSDSSSNSSSSSTSLSSLPLTVFPVYRCIFPSTRTCTICWNVDHSAFTCTSAPL